MLHSSKPGPSPSETLGNQGVIGEKIRLFPPSWATVWRPCASISVSVAAVSSTPATHAGPCAVRIDLMQPALLSWCERNVMRRLPMSIADDLAQEWLIAVHQKRHDDERAPNCISLFYS